MSADGWMRVLSSCFPCVHGRSPHSTQLYQIPSATSAVEVGKLVRNPGAVCVCGLYPCRARYRLYTGQHLPCFRYQWQCYYAAICSDWEFLDCWSNSCLLTVYASNHLLLKAELDVSSMVTTLKWSCLTHTFVSHQNCLIAALNFRNLSLSLFRCGLERESITIILRALHGRRCFYLERWSRSAVAQQTWSGLCSGRGSSLSGRA